LITDANGIPLACSSPPPTATTITQLLPLLEAIPPIRGTVGRPRQRPSLLLADRGYDSKAHRQALRARGIRPVIARRKTAHGSGLGSDRWVVERTLSWLRQHRRLRIRYERTAEIHEAFLSLACSLICLRTLSGPFC
jgi:transposase